MRGGALPAGVLVYTVCWARGTQQRKTTTTAVFPYLLAQAQNSCRAQAHPRCCLDGTHQKRGTYARTVAENPLMTTRSFPRSVASRIATFPPQISPLDRGNFSVDGSASVSADPTLLYPYILYPAVYCAIGASSISSR